MATTASARTLVRSEIDDLDSPPSHPVINENLARNVYASTNLINGTNKSFRLNNRRIVEPVPATTTLVVTRDGAILTPVTDFSDDPVRGGLTIITAAPTVSLYANYDFMLFLDSEIDNFLTSGLQFVGYTDIAQVPDSAGGSLVGAVIHKASALAFKALASRTAPQFSAGAGGKTINKDSIKKQYLDLAKDQEKQAVDERDMFYKRQGRRNAPAAGSLATQQTPYTPRR